ncbi:MAG: DUF4388 domain-containing protein [Actinobacteria bacterium]|nr:DUF4388 domain-containing protein [Actinomycetota bacterium]
MSLQGSLDTFALADVLRLLASTAKSGRLDVVGSRSAGQLWLVDGRLVAGEAELNQDLPDVVFELLRSDEGDFEFRAGEVHDEPGEQQDVDDVISAAEQLLGTWREIEAVVPHLGCRVEITAELPVDEVTIDRSRWGHLVAIGEGRSVGELGSRLGLGEFKVSQLVKELVDEGLVEVADASGGEPEVPVDDWARADVALGEGAEGADAGGVLGDLVDGDTVAADLDEVVRNELEDDSAGEQGSRDVALDEELLGSAGDHDYLVDTEEAALPEQFPGSEDVNAGANPFAHDPVTG